jgi:hypothetical protein
MIGESLAIAREVGDRYSEAGALFNLSVALDNCGDAELAKGHREAALEIMEERSVTLMLGLCASAWDLST